jgi:hypothetical protein
VRGGLPSYVDDEFHKLSFTATSAGVTEQSFFVVLSAWPIIRIMIPRNCPNFVSLILPPLGNANPYSKRTVQKKESCGSSNDSITLKTCEVEREIDHLCRGPPAETKDASQGTSQADKWRPSDSELAPIWKL